MIEEFKTISLLKAAENKAIRRALEARDNGQFSEKVKWEARVRYVSQQLMKFEMLKNSGSSVPTGVFISYSVNTGQTYYQYLEMLLKKRRFDILTGFQKVDDDEGNVLKRILKQLHRSTVFLGLLTKEHKMLTKKEVKWSPSVWTIEEKGMALAMDKPLVLMIESDLHDDFWKKTVPHKVHIFFTKENFYEKADEAVDAVVDRYNDRAKRIIDS